MTKQVEHESILDFDAVVFDASRNEIPVTISLEGGKMAFVRSRSIWARILGIRAVDSGEVRFLGRSWESRSVSETEDDRRMIGTVVNPRSQTSARWVTNLDVVENVLLGASFDRKRRSNQIMERVSELSKRFGFVDGISNLRPSRVPDGELIRAQWVRAFLPDPLKLLILENPLFHAPSGSVPAMIEAIQEALENGVAVLWISDDEPEFSNLGLEPELLLE